MPATERYIDNFLNERLPQLRIAVIGDVMVDRYVYGKVERISPEAPVPINKVDTVKSVLGGAANVAANLAHLDCRVFLAGLVGEDDNGELFKDLLRDADITGDGLISRPGHATTTKLRVLGARQQMVRLDFEEITPFTEAERARLAAWLDGKIAAGLDGIVLSDYNKGVFAAEVAELVIKAARKASVPVLVDPKGNDWSKYNGADFVTPNMKELSQCAGYEVPNEGEALSLIHISEPTRP